LTQEAVQGFRDLAAKEIDKITVDPSEALGAGKPGAEAKGKAIADATAPAKKKPNQYDSYRVPPVGIYLEPLDNLCLFVTFVRVSPDVAKLVQQCMNEKADLLGPAAVRALNPNAAAQQNTATKEQYLQFPHMMKEWTKKALPSVSRSVPRAWFRSLASSRHMRVVVRSALRPQLNKKSRFSKRPTRIKTRRYRSRHAVRCTCCRCSFPMYFPQ